MTNEVFTFKAQDCGRLNALQDIYHYAVLHHRAIIPVEGDCMEGLDIEDGGRVAVDFTRYPRPGRRENGVYVSGDPCICWAQPPSASHPSLMCKQYTCVWRGHQVGTRYKQAEGQPFRMNFGFPAILILGVVYASWSKDGSLIWERDPKIFPESLPDHCTIERGGSIDVGEVYEYHERG